MGEMKIRVAANGNFKTEVMRISAEAIERAGAMMIMNSMMERKIMDQLEDEYHTVSRLATDDPCCTPGLLLHASEAISAKRSADALQQIADVFEEHAGHVAESIDGLASAMRRLGTADACTPFGAIEALMMAFEKGLSEIATAISERSEPL